MCACVVRVRERLRVRVHVRVRVRERERERVRVLNRAQPRFVRTDLLDKLDAFFAATQKG